MEKEKEISNYYKGMIPKLILKYKVAAEQCLEVIERDLPEDLTEDRFVNVLKSKRMAADDAKHYAKEVDMLENELNGVEIEETTETKKTSWTKLKAKRPNE